MSGEDNCKLFVGGIPWSANREDLEAHFAQAGTVEDAYIAWDREMNRSRGFGFVTMSSPEEAQAAIEQFHEKEMGGRPITVNVARPREE